MNIKKFFSFKFPQGSTPTMENIINFHEKSLIVIIIVLLIVLFILVLKFFNLKPILKNLENQNFEIS
jgi:flagellar biosynthesis/type III secretory pathway M-ring protein FliF/YscJ